jgi:hypothetical protein
MYDYDADDDDDGCDEIWFLLLHTPQVYSIICKILYYYDNDSNNDFII